MSHQSLLEREVRDTIKKNRWLTLSTTSTKGIPQSSVVVYASDGYIIYILTGKNTVKVRNIIKNNRVSVTIPFYKNFIHRMISVAPPAAISFRATAETLDVSDSEAAYMYKKVLNFDFPEDLEADSLWIKLSPGKIATCYGVGISLLDLRDPSKAYKIIKLTKP
ncbi:MAG: pyridoxamine 5'-phosphate oxidase family protein [Promethearchaeota archaeon]|jgi:hypothetical protein